MKRLTLCIAIFFCVFAVVTSAWADTFVSGPVSGTWDMAGSPYVFTGDCTVLLGDVLTIEPGVEVIIGLGMQLAVHGQLLAIGNAGQHIVFRATSEPNPWGRVYVYGYENGSPTSRLEYCDFANAQTAIDLYVTGRDLEEHTSMQTEIMNCTFSNCQTAIYGYAYGRANGAQRYHASMDPIIEQCVFDGTGSGTVFLIQGSCEYHCGGGRANPTIRNCLFKGLTGTAFQMNKTEPYIHSSTPNFMNNTVVNCNRGVFSQDPYDADIKNNIFYGNTIAVERASGSTLSADVLYNDFYLNNSDFVGYPQPPFGDIVTVNRNGDPCDIFNNIFMDPLFVGDTNYHLTELSPCIDAGTDEGAPNTDIDGDSRPQGGYYDIGFDEYVGSPPRPPVPVIKANGTSATAYITTDDSLSVTVRLYTRDYAGTPAEWWICKMSPCGTEWLNPSLNWEKSDIPISVGQWPIFHLPERSILDDPTPSVGVYTYFFVLDDTRDGVFDIKWGDFVNVVVTNPTP